MKDGYRIREMSDGDWGDVARIYADGIATGDATFETEVPCRLDPADPSPFRVVFIRAPRLARLGPGVVTLLEHDGTPILVRQDRVVGGAFHPELTDDPRVHAWFLREVVGS